MNTAEQNAADLDAIDAAGVKYKVRKYGGAWVPIVIAKGKRHTFTHCSTSGGAMETAIRKAAEIARRDA